jgi:hypothetical protein
MQSNVYSLKEPTYETKIKLTKMFTLPRFTIEAAFDLRNEHDPMLTV